MTTQDRPRTYGPLTIGTAAAGTAVLALVAARGAVSGPERELFAWFNDLASGWAVVFVPVMHAGTLVAGPAVGVVALLARRRLLALELVGAGPAAWVLGRLLKLLVSRPRPSDLLDEMVVRGGEVGGLGYPSAHVTVAAALAAVAWAWLPRPWAWGAWVIVALVGLGRMYVGAHLPLDVLGGALLGGLIGAGVRALGTWGRSRGVLSG